MSPIKQLAQLESRLQELNQKYRLIQQENQFLLKKNETAKMKIEQILGQLTKPEVCDD